MAFRAVVDVGDGKSEKLDDNVSFSSLVAFRAVADVGGSAGDFGVGAVVLVDGSTWGAVSFDDVLVAEVLHFLVYG